MKKFLKGIFLFWLVLGLSTGCDSKENGVVEENSNKQTSEENDKNSTSINYGNSLVLYFSATSTTEGVAEVIAEVTGGDLVEIVPKKKYTSSDLNYNDKKSRANKEMNDEKARPEIDNKIDIEGYDTIYLGYPIWWGTNPKIILTLLDTYNFDNKNVVLFCTSGGSDISQSMSELKKYNSKMNIIDGKKFSGTIAKSDIESWINGLNR